MVEMCSRRVVLFVVFVTVMLQTLLTYSLECLTMFVGLLEGH